MLPTLGALLVTFVVTQFVPGGPVEQIPGRGRGAGGESGGWGQLPRGQGVDPKRVEQIKRCTASTSRRTSASSRCWRRCPLRPGAQLLPEQGRVAADQGEKLPVSISLGLWTFFISYLIVPLGVAKAVRAGTRFDHTTLLVLVGYAIPGFVLGVALLVVFGEPAAGFPLRGLTSGNWDELSGGARIVDYLAHRAAGHGHGGGQLRRDHHADQELVPRRRSASNTS